MDVKAVAARLISPSFGAGPQHSRVTTGFAGLASQYAAAKAGIVPGKAGGEFNPVYRSSARYAERESFEERDVIESRDILEQQEIRQTRDVIGTRDVVEERAIYEARAVYETRDVYEDRAVMQARVTGTRSLAPYDKVGQAGFQDGSQFTVTVGNGATAVITMVNPKQITLTVNGSTQTFNFDNDGGEYRAGLTDALNSITGLSAAFNSQGKLELATTDGQTLTLAKVGSSTPLTQLGLVAGTTAAELTGYRRVKTGTEQVQVGTEQVVIGTEQVVVGSEQYVAGTELVTIGLRQVKIGEELVVTGKQVVKLGTSMVLAGHDRELIGLERAEKLGTGVLGGGAGIREGTLPSGYVELLFGVLSSDIRQSVPAEQEEARSAYRAMEDHDSVSWAPEKDPEPAAGKTEAGLSRSVAFKDTSERAVLGQ